MSSAFTIIIIRLMSKIADGLIPSVLCEVSDGPRCYLLYNQFGILVINVFGLRLSE